MRVLLKKSRHQSINRTKREKKKRRRTKKAMRKNLRKSQ